MGCLLIYGGALSHVKHAQQSTMGKKICLSVHPRYSGSDLSPDRTRARPRHRYTNVKKRTGIQVANFFGSTYDIFSIKSVTRKFHVVTITTAKKCTKKCTARVKLFKFVFAY